MVKGERGLTKCGKGGEGTEQSVVKGERGLNKVW